jgi:hypothetical protein
VLAHDPALLAALELRVRTVPAERIPDRPGPGLVQHGLAGAAEDPVLEVHFESGSVASAEHREFGSQAQAGELVGGEHRANLGDELGWVFRKREQAEAERVVHVFVEHGAHCERA